MNILHFVCFLSAPTKLKVDQVPWNLLLDPHYKRRKREIAEVTVHKVEKKKMRAVVASNTCKKKRHKKIPKFYSSSRNCSHLV